MKSFSKIPISVLDLVGIPEGKTIPQAFQTSMKLAKLADKLDYKRYWFAEHHNMESVASSATPILINQIAGITENIRVGSGGIMLPNHAPLVVAEQFGTLDALHPDRIDMGLGRAPGTDQLTSIALRRDQRAVMDFEGNIREIQQYFNLNNVDAKVRAIPGEGANVPIWILGSSTDSAVLAAKMGLPYAFASHFAPAQLTQALQIYHNQFEPSAHLKRPYTMACVNVMAAESNEEAKLLERSLQRLFLGILTGQRQKLADPSGLLPLNKEELAACQQMIYYTFTGDKHKIRRDLDIFVNNTKIDELMVTTHIFDEKAKLNSFKIIKEAQEL